jgi:hypothetical protein
VPGARAYRQQAGVWQRTAFDEFVRESAYSWANRVFTLRCMEARNLIDLVILPRIFELKRQGYHIQASEFVSEYGFKSYRLIFPRQTKCLLPQARLQARLDGGRAG